jgi:hypothetical protein
MIKNNSSKNSDNNIPSVIWFYWHQGLEKAPELIRECLKSWQIHNPSWKIIFLDQSNLSQYVNFQLPEHVLKKIGLVKQSNLLRLQLMLEYGGVWTDATVICRKPLDQWLPSATTSGFFAFYKPGRDRLISSWFLVAEKGSPIVKEFLREYRDFFLENTFDNQNVPKKRIVKFLGKILNRTTKTTRFWFFPIITKFLKVYPYFILHYSFSKVVYENELCASIWDKTTKLSAIPPHKIQRYGMLSKITEKFRNEVDNDDCPLYKLSRHFDPEMQENSSVLTYLYKINNK